MEPVLVHCINNNIQHFMYRNAIFLCERLCAENPSELNLQLLATCYLQNNQAHCAYYILKGTKLARSRYLFAVSCLKMDRLREAELALSPVNEPNSEVPNGAAGHYLLGLIYRYTDRRKSAIDQFMQAIKIDPFLWVAYEELCILGAANDSAEVFGETAVLQFEQQHLSSELSSCSLHASYDHQNYLSTNLSSSDDASPRKLRQLHGNNVKETPYHFHGPAAGPGSQHFNYISSNGIFSTPSPISAQLGSVAPPPLHRNPPMQSHMHALGELSPTSTSSSIGQAPRRKFVDDGKLRKVSGKLFSESGLRRSTRLAGEIAGQPHPNQVGGNGIAHPSGKLLGGFSSKVSSSLRSVTVRRGQPLASENIEEVRRSDSMNECSLDDTPTTSQSVSSTDDLRERYETNTLRGGPIHGLRERRGILELLCLLRTLGEGFRLTCLYRCQDALDIYLKLPPKQYATGWVLSQVGRTYFEMVEYLKAEDAFSWARQVSPYTLEGMDVYSTVLFHLQESMKLGHLALELNSIDRLSPQSWCVSGNFYSLQKDHETALKNFQRAIHLDSRFSYAHTLCGHEYVALEDFENGVKSYQSALRINPRHVNAWYGLGMIYCRQEKFEFAEHHFRKAFDINPCSSVLMCQLGMALHSLKRDHDALQMLNKAISADPENPLPMYNRAKILASLERFDEALRDLEFLRERVPRESSVHALMGRIYSRFDQFDKAMFHYGFALDLKPTDADVAAIKTAMEKLQVPDELPDF